HADEAAKLLNDNFPSFLGNTDVAVLRLAILGAAYRINQKFQDSERVLGRAEALATSSHPELLPKVLIEKGSLEVDEGELPSASMSYHQALTLSQAQGNKDQEAAALVNLARLDISERHFAEAIDQSASALETSRSLGKETFVATALGNLGWSYYELGDYEASLDHYSKGAEASKKQGLGGYSTYWYTGVANARLALPHYRAANIRARSTLQSALDLKNNQTIAECLNDLTRIMLATNRTAEADQFNKRALAVPDKFGELDALLSAGWIAAAQARFND